MTDKNNDKTFPNSSFSDTAGKTLQGSNVDSVILPEDVLPEITIDTLPPEIQKACHRAGWTSLMPVQSKAIPYILAGRNLMIQSRTGSGKTGAYLLPLLKLLDANHSQCQALIITPTRELALQVTREADRLLSSTLLKTVTVYGGVAYSHQIEMFRQGVQVVVGTPGRILDHLLKGTLSLEHLVTLIFDEADRMLSMGFYPDMMRLQRFLPRQRMTGQMLSATFPAFVLRLAEEFLDRPDFLSLSRDGVHVAETNHVCYIVPGMGRERSLARIIETENPVSALIFCNTKASVHFVAVVLKRFGYDVDELSSDLAQGAREKVMARIRKGTLRFLITTDVAARGIDIPQLSHVIQYEPPEDPELYIHRAGRTGRAGAAGTAITLTAGMEQFALKNIGRKFGIEFQERVLPTDEDIQKIVSERVIALLEAKLRSRDALELERLQRFIPLGRNLAEGEEELAVIAMLLDDYYQQNLHAPPQPLPGSSALDARDRPPRNRRGRGKHSRKVRNRSRNGNISHGNEGKDTA
jgi:ATP-dependent RNA helicase DeaD